MFDIFSIELKIKLEGGGCLETGKPDLTPALEWRPLCRKMVAHVQTQDVRQMSDALCPVRSTWDTPQMDAEVSPSREQPHRTGNPKPPGELTAERAALGVPNPAFRKSWCKKRRPLTETRELQRP